jgi:septal ring factor EnvC (AmiA/AmiB activator)
MKTLTKSIVILFFFAHISQVFGQSKKELQLKIQELNSTIIRHDAQIMIMEKSISDLTNKIARLEAQLEMIQLQNNRIENNIYQPNPTQTSDAPHTNQTNPSIPTSIKTQCLGITKAGNRCKRSAGPSGYCYQHGN